MLERDIIALESYQLIAKVLHNVHEVNSHLSLLGQDLAAPIVPLIDMANSSSLNVSTLSLIKGELALAQADGFDFSKSIPLLKTAKMGELMPRVRKLAAKNVPAIALDFTLLAETFPFGNNHWKPKTKEDLAELRAAAGCPVWLYGIASPIDAKVAAEAGLEAIIVHSGTSYYLNGPASIEIFPEVFDAVAGMISVYVAGSVRSGIDVFRYLAIGAEAVIVDSDRSLANLQAELAYAMRLTACETLADIGYEAIYVPLFKELG